MNTPFKYILLILFSVLFSINLYSQESKFFDRRHKIGFDFGYGTQDLLDVSYFYEISFFQLQHYYSLIIKENWSLEIISQPQINKTIYKVKNESLNIIDGYEFGINAGVLFRKSIIKNSFNIYTFLSSGPHFVSGVPERQAKGFIFSDNLFLGFDVRVINKIYLDIRFGVRHISNAGLKQPNWGINNIIGDLGFYIIL